MKNDRLKNLRVSRGLTVRELAEDVGIDFSIISAIENGRRKLNVTYASKLADYFHVDIDFLLYHTEADLLDTFEEKLLTMFNEYEKSNSCDKDKHLRLACMKMVLNLTAANVEIAYNHLKFLEAQQDFGSGK
jgi:transcriptional regulator with XRE-family HTH domain